MSDFMSNKPQHVIEETLQGCTGFSSPIPFRYLSKIKGDPLRHLEQLWDEIKKLKERVKDLESKTKE